MVTRAATPEKRDRHQNSSDELHAEGHGVAAPEAKGGQTGAEAPISQCIQQGGEHPGPTGADRMTEGHRTAMHIHPVPIPSELASVGKRLYCERLVGLYEIVVSDLRVSGVHESADGNARRKKKAGGSPTAG